MARREVMAQWVDAILVAVRMVRTPLAAFYRSLDDEQKARFAITYSAGRRGNAAEPWLGSCRDPLDASASVPVDPIVRRLRLTEAQAAALEDFSLASDQAAQKVRDSCPREAPLTPTRAYRRHRGASDGVARRPRHAASRSSSSTARSPTSRRRNSTGSAAAARGAAGEPGTPCWTSSDASRCRSRSTSRPRQVPEDGRPIGSLLLPPGAAMEIGRQHEQYRECRVCQKSGATPNADLARPRGR